MEIVTKPCALFKKCSNILNIREKKKGEIKCTEIFCMKLTTTDLISTNPCMFLLLHYLSTYPIFRSRPSLFSNENEKDNLHFIGRYLDSQRKGKISFGLHRSSMLISHINTTDWRIHASEFFLIEVLQWIMLQRRYKEESFKGHSKQTV